MNEAIAIVNLIIGVAFLALGGVLLWQARRTRQTWPVSALVALAGPFFGAGAVWLHLTGWRFWNLPGEAFDRDGGGTLTLRIIVAVVVLALLQRIFRGKLLTDGDRKRVDTA